MPLGARTMSGIRAALAEAVPRAAQRARLLEALARVPGNRVWRRAIAALQAEEPPRPRPAADDALPRLRARLVPYSQGAPEVVLTLSKRDAEELVRDLEAAGAVINVPGFMEQGVLGRLLRAVRDASGSQR